MVDRRNIKFGWTDKSVISITATQKIHRKQTDLS